MNLIADLIEKDEKKPDFDDKEERITFFGDSHILCQLFLW